MTGQYKYLILLLSLLVSGCTGSNVLIDQKYTAQASDHYQLEINSNVALPAPEMKILQMVMIWPVIKSVPL